MMSQEYNTKAEESKSLTPTGKLRWYSSIRTRVMMIAAIPLFFVLVMSSTRIAQLYAMYNEIDETSQLIDFAVVSSAYVHELQMERGYTGGYIASQYQLFRDELIQQRLRTDTARQQFEKFLAHFDVAPFNTNVQEHVNKVAQHLAGYEDHRSQVDNQLLTEPVATAFYTDRVQAALGSIHRIDQHHPDSEYIYHINAFADLLQIKEYTGQERAVISSLFASDLDDQQAINQVSKLLGNQHAFQAAFFELANREQLEFYRQMMTNDVVDEVARMEQIVLDLSRVQPSDLVWQMRFDTIQVQQWLTDISVTRALDGLDDGFERAEMFANSFRTQLKELQSMAHGHESELDELLQSFNAFYDKGRWMADLYINHGTAEGNSAMGEFDQYAEDINNRLIGLSETVTQKAGFNVDAEYWFDIMTQKIDLIQAVELKITSDMNEYVSREQAQAIASLQWMIAFACGVLLVSCVLVIGFGRQIVNPINQLLAHSQRVAAGDFSSSLESYKNDEIGALGRSFQKMVASLNDSFLEISEQKNRTEELLQDSINHRTTIDEHAFVSVTDIRGNITYVNDKFVEISGYSRDDLLGQNHRLINSGHHPKEFFRDMWKTIASKNIWNGDVKNRAKDGSEYWVNATIIPFRDRDGKITKYFAIRTDISQTKFAEEEAKRANIELQHQAHELLEQQNELENLNKALKAVSLLAEESAEAAQRADQTKSEFLANMSHEIRTPMTAILGFAETLADSVTYPENIEAVSIIQKNGEHLLTIINDILDLSKLDSGKMTVESIDVLPVGVTNDVADLVKHRAESKGLDFNIQFGDMLPETVQSDPTRLRQVLINLMGNAIKFTEQGSVTLHTHFEDIDGDGYIHFDVIDTGIGMTNDQVSKLFMPFVQADSSTTRKFGGTGLGLTISKRFAKLLGGDISVPRSVSGEGTTFRATIYAGSTDSLTLIDSADQLKSDDSKLALTGHASGNPSKSTNKDLQGLRILLAEDGPDNQKLISFVLKKAGADVEVAENGEIAMNRALQEQALDQPFDCILMDMQMPVMSGYESTSTLRDRGYVHPIIALTAHAMAGDREKCLNAGCDDFANKPIDRKGLIATIVQHTQGRAGSSNSQAA